MRPVTRWYRIVLSFGLFLFAIAMIGVCHGQDHEQIKEKALASLAKIENYPAVIVKGTTISRGDPSGRAHLQVRGNKMWMENDSVATANDADRRRLISVFDVMGTTGFLHTTEFDGKRSYEFNPYNLTLDVRTVRNTPGKLSECALLPRFWLHMGGSEHLRFRDVIRNKKYETQIEKIAEGRWKLSQSNLGSNLPEGVKVALSNCFVIVDEKCDYLVTEYFGDGFVGKMAGTMIWESQDGNWYAKQGKESRGEKPYAEWNIEEISFDAAKCRNSFNELESLVPFATQIRTFDEKQKQLSSKFKGGADGESEHRLRELARLKRMRDGF